MKLKLDENLGSRGAELFRAAGHDVATVPEQQLTSASDREVITACQAEQRCLVTLDQDFANPLVFEPKDYAGIAVLRLPSRPTPDDLWAACRILITALAGTLAQDKGTGNRVAQIGRWQCVGIGFRGQSTGHGVTRP